ncbi:MAG: glycosyltransferase family 2 protein [Firmicutes bacterium]|nr:glycosyltransferase family 2 protein [Bacillota bacterium]MCL5014994.1 glycosyltransferase family 2 protein [Bacillota bacterium]
MNNRVDIVVISYNCVDYLKRCINSIERYTDYPYALWIVDNASTDGTQEYLHTLSRATVIPNPVNRGYAQACNQGARLGTGRYILFLNADTEATPGWLSPLVKCFESDSHIAVVGPKLVNYDNKIVGAGVVGANGSPLIRGWMEPDDPDRFAVQTDCLSVCGAAYMIRRDLIPELGLFDEHYFFYFEETDYSYNARYNGYRVVYCPASRMYHAVAASSQDKTPEQLRGLFMESERYFQQKWGEFLKEVRTYGDEGTAVSSRHDRS